MSETPSIHTDPKRRHDFVLLFDVTDGNPNGDPDAGNMPRVDPESGQGLVTDVAIKRKVRDYVDALRGQDDPHFKIYIQHGAILNNQHRKAYEALGLTSKSKTESPGVKDWMCQNFFDVRTFGAVMSTEVNAGQVRGPVQITFARSIDRILPMEATITRVALTKTSDAKVGEDGEEQARTGTMGRKAFIPYGLYRAQGYFVPSYAKDTGFDADDLSVLWQALQNMWDLDRSASRGATACRGLYVFTHDTALGNAPSHKLFERISVPATNGSPRRFTDYTVTVNDADLPQGVTLTRLLEG